jgi:copper chaperone CopZ
MEEVNMKKKFKVENLDCAHCAAKMEEAIKKIPGVEDAVMNFMMQKLTLEIADDADMNDILDKAQEAISKVSIVCEIIR